MNEHQSKLKPEDNKFHKGNGSDQKHYWLTPPELMTQLQLQFEFDADGAPYPRPEGFNGLTDPFEGKTSIYFNPPFGSTMELLPGYKKPRKTGPTAWMRKAIELSRQGKRVVVVYPIDKWILMMIQAGAKITNLGDVRWCATEDGSQGKGTGRHIAQFVLEAGTTGKE